MDTYIIVMGCVFWNMKEESAAVHCCSSTAAVLLQYCYSIGTVVLLTADDKLYHTITELSCANTPPATGLPTQWKAHTSNNIYQVGRYIYDGYSSNSNRHRTRGTTQPVQYNRAHY